MMGKERPSGRDLNVTSQDKRMRDKLPELVVEGKAGMTETDMDIISVQEAMAYKADGETPSPTTEPSSLPQQELPLHKKFLRGYSTPDRRASLVAGTVNGDHRSSQILSSWSSALRPPMEGRRSTSSFSAAPLVEEPVDGMSVSGSSKLGNGTHEGTTASKTSPQTRRHLLSRPSLASLHSTSSEMGTKKKGILNMLRRKSRRDEELVPTPGDMTESFHFTNNFFNDFTPEQSSTSRQSRKERKASERKRHDSVKPQTPQENGSRQLQNGSVAPTSFGFDTNLDSMEGIIDMSALNARSNSLPNALTTQVSRPPQFVSPFDGSRQAAVLPNTVASSSRHPSIQSSELSSSSILTSRRGSRTSDAFPDEAMVSYFEFGRPSESAAIAGRRRSRDHLFYSNGARSNEGSGYATSPPRSPTNVGRHRLNTATRKNSIVEALSLPNGRRDSISPLGNQLQLEDDNQAWQAPDSWAILKDEEGGAIDPANDGEEDEGDLRHGQEHKSPNAQRSLDSKTQNANFCIRIFRADATFATISHGLYMTTQELIHLLFKKFFMPESNIYKVYIRERGLERALGLQERPLMIQKRRLEQMGYLESDKLEDLGREDISYLCHFTFRPASVPGFGVEEERALGDCEKVELNDKNLQTIPIFLYQHVDRIRCLDLSRNPMLDLPSDFISSCVNLEDLRLRESCVKRIHASIQRAVSIKRLDLACNRIKDLLEARLDRIPELTQLMIQNNRISAVPAYFAKFEGLKVLNISNNKIELFPPAICEIKSLEHLDISFNSLSSLPDSISALEKLQKLLLAGNKLVHLPTTMKAMPALRELDCRRNDIVSLDAVDYLPNLKSVKCSYNAITVFDGHFESMEEVNLWRNPITKFAINGTASTLSQLNLSSAKISSLPESIFIELRSLKVLNLGHNHLTFLPASICNLTDLTQLDITYNSISLLPVELGQMTSLKELFCHNNNLKCLPETIWLCPSLLCLNVSSNILETFPDPPPLSAITAAKDSANLSAELYSQKAEAFGRKSSVITLGSGAGVGRLPLAMSLQKLFLADNRLNDDMFTPLSLFSELRVINLSYNDIFDISHLSLHRNLNLQQLHLSGNQITSLPADEIERLSSLVHLHVNGNKLQTLPAEIGKIRHLMVLDVGCNALKYNIANWPYDWNWNWNLELRYLNLSGNKRLEIKPGQGGAPNPLLKNKNLADFGALKDLRVLGLMDVTLIMSSIPDESADRRIRTSASEINDMAYGIADTLGTEQHLSYTDLVIPKFRALEDECIFGLFSGPATQSRGSLYAKFLQEHLGSTLMQELSRKSEEGANDELVVHSLRRCFLSLDKQLAEAFDPLVRTASATTTGEVARDYGFQKGDINSGCGAVMVYIRQKTMFVANCGDAFAVVSRNGGNASLVSTRHRPFEPEETARIRAAEGWVSTQGLVNDELAVSRSFGYFKLVPIVTAAPSIEVIQLTDSDEFVIMASESLWNCMSYQTAVDIARTEKEDLMLAAQKLRDFAIAYGAEEKVVVMVIGVGALFESKAAKARRKGLSTRDMNDGADSYILAAKKAGRRGKETLADSTLARLEREVPPPVGQVALVFTDIKNSTLLWETNPAMQSAMRIHNGIMRRQLRVIGGYEVKTEGDAFMVSFQSVTSAMLWCVTVQLELLKADWPQEIFECEDGREVKDCNGKVIYRGLRVRMGVHYGTPVCESDPITRRMDYFGPMVNRSARVSGTADGGQIMVSADVMNELTAVSVLLDTEPGVESKLEDLASTDLLDPAARRDLRALRQLGYGIVEVGERKLKGLETPERLSLVYPKELLGRLETERAPSATIHVSSDSRTSGAVNILTPGEVRRLANVSFRLAELFSRSSQKLIHQDDMDVMLHRIVSEDVSYFELMALLHILIGQVESHCTALQFRHLRATLQQECSDMTVSSQTDGATSALHKAMAMIEHFQIGD